MKGNSCCIWNKVLAPPQSVLRRSFRHSPSFGCFFNMAAPGSKAPARLAKVRSHSPTPHRGWVSKWWPHATLFLVCASSPTLSRFFRLLLLHFANTTHPYDTPTHLSSYWTFDFRPRHPFEAEIQKQAFSTHVHTIYPQTSSY